MITVQQELTCWYATNDLREPFKFNHISNGFDPDALQPTPICEHQRQAWRNKFWRPVYALLIDGKVVEDERRAGLDALENGLRDAYDRIILNAFGRIARR